jgi:hydroxymethylpyrimidine pyrophosphatase-like HAD family hydrolase
MALPFEAGDFTETQMASLESLGRCLDSSCVDILALNTGRSLESALLVARAIKSTKMKYVIAEHGAIGFSLDTNELIDFKLLAHDIPDLQATYMTLNMIPGLITWYQDKGKQLLAREIGHEIEASPKKANLTLGIPGNVTGEVLKRALRTLIEKDSPLADQSLVYHHSNSDGYVDVMSKVDKGSGARLICLLESANALKAEIETFAIGNGMNDISLFEAVDNMICPGNSDREVIDFCGSHGLVSEFAYVDATKAWLRTLS